ncbi:MAG: glycosyltransferase family 39 protein [Chloroflexi bacterium]|nr:glycosyltransferase family 39 protein [Chloroflexota bacterium]
MKRGHLPRGWGIALFVAWLFAVYAAFYWVQKPFTPETAWALLRAGLDIAAASGIIILGAALGRRILVWLGLADLPSSDLVWLAPALGLGGLGLVGLGLGLAGGWSRPLVYGLALAGALLLARDGLALARQLGKWRPSLAVGRWGRRYLALTLALTVLLALAPPTSWDGLFYHLTGPALYVAQGGITPLEVNIPHLAFPSLMEMLFGLGLLLRGDVTAKLLHLAYGLLLAALVYRLSHRWQGRKAAGWSLLLLAAMPMVAVLAAWAYNDLALAFYQLAALYGLLAWQETRRPGWLLAGGLLSGLALGLKYTAFPLPLVGLVYLLWQRRETRFFGKNLVSYALLTGLVAAPWYLRNWAFTGNPIYPFLLDGQNWDGFRSNWYAHAGTGIGWHPLPILALPATMTLGLRDVNYYDGRMGPLFLALAPVLVWLAARAWRQGERPPRRRTLVLLGGFAAVHGLVWTLGAIQSRALFQSRLFLPGFVALMPLLAETLAQLPVLNHRKFSLSAFVQMLMGVALALNLVNQALDVLRFNPFGYLVGYESREAYLERTLGDHYRAVGRLAEIVPEDGRVLFLWEPRSYYSPRPAQPDAILDNWSHLVYLYDEEALVAAQLRAEGFTHVLLYRWGLDFVIEHDESPLPPEDVERLDAFVEHHLMLVETVGRYQLYSLREQ